MVVLSDTVGVLNKIIREPLNLFKTHLLRFRITVTEERAAADLIIFKIRSWLTVLEDFILVAAQTDITKFRVIAELKMPKVSGVLLTHLAVAAFAKNVVKAS